MSRQIILALGGGAVSAIVSVAFLTGSPIMLFMANLAPLPLFLVGLGAGAGAGSVAGVAGLVAAVVLGGTVAGAMFGLVFALPTWFVTQRALKARQTPNGVAWTPLGTVLSELSVLVAAISLGGGLVFLDGSEGLAEAVSLYIANVFMVLAPQLAEADRAQLVAAMVPTFPATGAISLILVIAGNALAAQSLLARSGRNRRPNEPLATFAVPDWMSWVLVGAAALALVGPGDIGYAARNLVIVAAVPFFVLGMAVVHDGARRTPAPGAILILCYMVTFIFGWARLGVTAIGVAEAWVGIRGRIGGPPAKQENE